MILYTPLAQEDIYQASSSDYQKQSVVQVQEKSCAVERLENGDLRLVQLLSTDPNDFLNEQFLPGTIVKPDNDYGKDVRPS
ncbi:hypothetical protein J416_10201 [Gracilibacillus halophilus YIM-C55.5]|uniref:YlzJ-like protein n=1 Tax=Gracilibacillus halophilus YIM-C55.5 TaxID=1308866 RepID=N4WK53_9BACI|nr:YlzJ-like family protein [Gracilibacillus halophilus]ENH96532.1 hypothetical protein J416_10201 [Gracilibacillus halophilus YIM-C55.5]